MQFDLLSEEKDTSMKTSVIPIEIPVVFFHVGGNQDYFKYCVNKTAVKNIVYLIGDESNKNEFTDNPNVVFFHVDDLVSNELQDFKEYFVNYSTNDYTYEKNCFLRVFYLKTLIEKTGKEWVFHSDSDSIIFEDVSKVFEEQRNVAYSIQKDNNKFYMASSINNALLNINFCNVFIELCIDVYKTKTRYHLISGKVEWHNTTGMPGGICDMTFYHLIHSENLIDPVIDLNIPINLRGEYGVFDHNVTIPYGYKGENTYVMENGNKKIIKNIHNENMFVTSDGFEFKAFSVHLQGPAKYSFSSFNL